MKGYSTFPKIPGLEPHCWEILNLCRDTDGVFYFPRWEVNTHVTLYIYIYIYIYIYSHPQIVSLYYNYSVWLDTQYARSWDWNLADFTSAWYSTAQPLTNSCFVYMYTLNGFWVLNSLKELCITLVATGNFFARMFNLWWGSISHVCVSEYVSL